MHEIVGYTNAEGRQKAESREQEYKDISVTELKAYLGVLILGGTRNDNKTEIHELFSKKYGLPYAKATLSRDRLKAIHSNLRFDDKNTRAARRHQSLFAPLQEVHNYVTARMRRHYIPGTFITIDEQLVGFRGRCAFRQYMPSKPDKYGLKLFMAVDSETLYPLSILPYLGRQTSAAAGGQGLGHYLVTEMTQRFYGTGRNVTCDRYFTSLKLARTLLQNKTTIVGTLTMNKRFIPKEFTEKKNRPAESSLFGFHQDKMTLVSYVPKPRKSVILLSSQHNSADVVREAKNKPEIILFYNNTKGGVDTVDWMVKKYTCRRISRRWPVVLFLNLVDLALLSAYIIWNLTHPEQLQTVKRGRRKLFLRSVGEALIKPHIRLREAHGTPQVKRTIQEAGFSQAVDEIPSARQPASPVKRRRCYKCPQSKDGKFKTICVDCKKNLCPQHTLILCSNCLVENDF